MEMTPQFAFEKDLGPLGKILSYDLAMNGLICYGMDILVRPDGFKSIDMFHNLGGRNSRVFYAFGEGDNIHSGAFGYMRELFTYEDGGIKLDSYGDDVPKELSDFINKANERCRHKYGELELGIGSDGKWMLPEEWYSK